MTAFGRPISVCRIGLVQTDYVQRYDFEHLRISRRLVCLTGAWTRILKGYAYEPAVAELVGHATASAVLLGANQKDARRVTLKAQASGPGRLPVTDCTDDYKVRGMAQYAWNDEAPSARHARL